MKDYRIDVLRNGEWHSGRELLFSLDYPYSAIEEVAAKLHWILQSPVRIVLVDAAGSVTPLAEFNTEKESI